MFFICENPRNLQIEFDFMKLNKKVFLD